MTHALSIAADLSMIALGLFIVMQVAYRGVHAWRAHRQAADMNLDLETHIEIQWIHSMEQLTVAMLEGWTLITVLPIPNKGTQYHQGPIAFGDDPKILALVMRENAYAMDEQMPPVDLST